MADRDLPRALVDGFDINHLTQEFLNDPFPTYKALRELDPVHKNEDGSYFLTRYADVKRPTSIRP